jgi:hypothetical protein
MIYLFGDENEVKWFCQRQNIQLMFDAIHIENLDENTRFEYRAACIAVGLSKERLLCHEYAYVLKNHEITVLSTLNM